VVAVLVGLTENATRLRERDYLLADYGALRALAERARTYALATGKTKLKEKSENA
jgi:hypothetical protein